MHTLKKGDKVYKVVPIDFPLPDKGPQFIVQARTLRVASAKQLRLDSYFSFGMGLIYEPGALGREFYASPREAVDAFERGHEQHLMRKIKERQSAEERLDEVRAWAEQWRKENP